MPGGIEVCSNVEYRSLNTVGLTVLFCCKLTF